MYKKTKPLRHRGLVGPGEWQGRSSSKLNGTHYSRVFKNDLGLATGRPLTGRLSELLGRRHGGVGHDLGAAQDVGGELERRVTVVFEAVLRGEGELHEKLLCGYEPKCACQWHTTGLIRKYIIKTICMQMELCTRQYMIQYKYEAKYRVYKKQIINSNCVHDVNHIYIC